MLSKLWRFMPCLYLQLFWVFIFGTPYLAKNPFPSCRRGRSRKELKEFCSRFANLKGAFALASLVPVLCDKWTLSGSYIVVWMIVLAFSHSFGWYWTLSLTTLLNTEVSQMILLFPGYLVIMNMFRQMGSDHVIPQIILLSALRIGRG